MKIGVRAHDFGRKTPNELAETLKDAGLEACQLALTKAIIGIDSIYDVKTDDLIHVEKAFCKHDIEISVLGCYMEIGLPDKEERLAEVEKFLKGLEYAKELGLKLVGTETTNFSTSSMEGKLSREDAYLNMKDSVLRMVETAERLNVNVGIEPVADHTLYSAEMTRRLIDEVNSAKLRVIFDPVNLILTQSDIEMQEQIFSSFLNLLGEEILALHVKDIVLENGEKIWRNIGKGSINIKPVVDRLLKINPSISALREEVKPESADIDVKALRELVGKARKEHTL